MRYITNHDDLILYRNDGTIGYNPVNGIPYKFSPQGVLIVGSITTDTGAANKIDASVQSDINDQLMRLFKTDLLGATSVCVEMCGQGSLTKTNDSGSSLTNLVDGYRGIFFKAPVLSGTTTPVTGQRYRVLTASVAYNSATYYAGEEFDVVAGGGNITSASGTYAVSIPKELKNGCDAFLDEEFKIKHLQQGDEPKDYYLFNEYGFDSKSSSVSADSDYFNWTR